jgi:hypothetical protein
MRSLRELEYRQNERQRDNERNRDERLARERSLRSHDIMM